MSTPPPTAADHERLEAERAAIEAQLARMSTAELALQAAVSLLNLGGRRLGLTGGDQRERDPAGRPDTAGARDTAAERDPADERDLEQVRDAIDGVRGLMPVLERRMAGELRFLRDALSQLQMAYAREARAGAGAGAAPDPQAGPEPQRAAGDTTGERAAPAQQPAAAAEGEGEGEGGGADETQAGAQGDRSPGPAETSGRLWVPKR